MKYLRRSTFIRIAVYGGMVVLAASVWAWSLGFAMWHGAVVGAILGLAVGIFTVLFQGVTEEPMMVDIDDAGTTMTMIGLFSGLLTEQNPFLPLTACKGAPCAGG